MTAVEVRATVPTRVEWRPVLIFVGLAYALMWVLTLPLWLSGRGLATPGAPVIMIVAMFSPAAASFVVCRWVERRPWVAAVGLRSDPGPRPVRRAVLASVAAAVLMPIAFAVATALGAGLGIVRLDLAHLSGLAAYAAKLPIPGLTPTTFLLIMVAQALVASVSVNAVAALGEETGWRGFLLPALLPLGRVPALVITGVVWALWHLPLILLGYEYPGADRGFAIAAFVVFCVAAGALLGWLRLRSGSVIPAAVGHGAVNSWAGLPPLLVAAGATDRPLLTAPAGLLGALVLAVVAGLLWWRRPPTLPG